LIVFASSDHAGFELRTALVAHLRASGVSVEDLGPGSPRPCDYPDEARAVARQISGAPAGTARGLLVCGSGIGMCIAANRWPGVRAVNAWSTESARLSRAHNDANVLCLGARLITAPVAREILDAWLATAFEAGRHTGRVAKLDVGTGAATGIDRLVDRGPHPRHTRPEEPGRDQTR
jgi:ribose 5-phosphate isomerase B